MLAYSTDIIRCQNVIYLEILQTDTKGISGTVPCILQMLINNLISSALIVQTYWYIICFIFQNVLNKLLLRCDQISNRLIGIVIKTLFIKHSRYHLYILFTIRFQCNIFVRERKQSERDILIEKYDKYYIPGRSTHVQDIT